MRKNEFNLEELGMILKSIEQVRAEWQLLISEKLMERGSDYKEILLCEESRVIQERLINLYGVLGNQAGEYSAVLFPEQVSIFLKKVA